MTPRPAQPPPVPRGPINPPRGCVPHAEQAQILAGAPAGLEPRARDRRILRWLADCDTCTVLTIASWITRARARTGSH